MDTVKRTIYVRVFGLEGYEDYGFDLDVDLTEEEANIFDALDDATEILEETEGLSDLMKRSEQDVYQAAVEEFTDLYPEAPDEDFNDACFSILT